jgi:hypothetical protein
MKGIVTAALGAISILAITAGSASADIACNREGDCWHVRESRHFRPEHGVVIHPRLLARWCLDRDPIDH